MVILVKLAKLGRGKWPTIKPTLPGMMVPPGWPYHDGTISTSFRMFSTYDMIYIKSVVDLLFNDPNSGSSKFFQKLKIGQIKQIFQEPFK